MQNLSTTLDAAQRHQRDGEHSSAELLYRQVLRADPFNAEAAFLLAGACQAQNKTRAGAA